MDEVKDIRDKAEAMAAYARQAKDSQLIEYATEIKVRAERRCGELLTKAERAKAGDNQHTRSSHDTSTKPTLRDIGLTPDQSSRYQQLAAMPEAKGAAAKEWKTRSDDTTTLGEMGITKEQSSRWQQVASIPEKHFEAAVEIVSVRGARRLNVRAASADARSSGFPPCLHRAASDARCIAQRTSRPQS